MPSISLKKTQLVARVLLAIMFCESALSHAFHFENVVTDAASMGLPIASILLPISICIEVFGVTALLLNRWLKLALLLLFVFTLSSTFLFFPFWSLEENEAATALQNFVKNFALLGFLLLMYAESDSKSRTAS
ncbi:hypothetical protein BM527_07520 [Alteromonas sp. Mex14]|nr:hypothetical protein BM527_07520 [Alteromonas sp. Mex14]